jgi:hypothetical protein
MCNFTCVAIFLYAELFEAVMERSETGLWQHPLDVALHYGGLAILHWALTLLACEFRRDAGRLSLQDRGDEEH